jgi:hypothetical protein
MLRLLLAGLLQTEELRDTLRHERHLSLVGALMGIADELALSGSTIAIDDPIGSRVRTTVLPLRVALAEPDTHGIRPLLEGGGSWATVEGDSADLFAGALPGQELGIDTKWRMYGGQAGGGAEMELGSGMRMALTALAGLHHVENKTGYSGAGQAFWQPLFDGILFNWRATVLSFGGALRIHGEWSFSEAIHLEMVFRYDGRAYETLQSTDEAQETVDPTHAITLRAEPYGPLGLEIAGRPLGWRGLWAYRRYFGDSADALGFDDYFEVGLAIEADVRELLPAATKITLAGAAIWGSDVQGWTAGVSLSF